MIPVIFYGNFVKLSLSKEKPPILKKTSVLYMVSWCDLNAWPLESERYYVRCLHRSDY